MPMFPIDELQSGGLERQPAPEPQLTWHPTWRETLGAAFSLNSQAESFAEWAGTAASRAMATPVPGYDPLSPGEIAGYEDHAMSFVDVQSPEEAWFVKRKIDRENAARRTLAESGTAGYVAGLAAGLLDPVNLLPFGIVLKGVGAGRVLYGVGSGALSAAGVTAASEAALHATQETRTLEESAFAVGTATILGGLMGGAFGAVRSGLIPGVRSQADLERSLEAALAETLPGGGPASAGAAAVKPLSLEGEGIAPALGLERLSQMGGLGRAVGNPLLRALGSPSADVRSLATELAENPLWQAKNLRGEASPVAIETAVKMWNGQLASALTDVDDLFVRYRMGRDRQTGDILRIGAEDMLGRRPPGQLSYDEFRAAISYAMRRGDQSGIPEVASAAKALREKLFDPTKARAIEAGLLSDDVEVTTADSYLTRVYDVPRIIAQRPQFERIIADWMDEVRGDVETRFDTAQKAISGSRSKVEKLEAQISEVEAKLGSAGPDEVEALKRTIDTLKASRDKGLRGVQRGEERIEADRIFAGLDRQEIDAIASEIADAIIGHAPGRQLLGSIPLAKPRGALKERTLNIPDARIEAFLENDIERVARTYLRTVAPDIELARRFGSVDMESAFAKVRDSYRALRRDKGLPEKDGAAQPVSWISRAVEKIRGVIDAAKQPGHAPAKASLGRVSDWLAAEAKRVGLDISGFRHAIDGSAIRHMINRHMNAKTEANRGQIPLTEADFTAIPDVLASPDALVFGTKTQGNKDQIAFIKRMSDGSILYLEEVRTGRRELAAMSMRKYPAAKDFSAIVDTLPSNARSDGGVTLNVVENPKHVTAIEPEDAVPAGPGASDAPPLTPEQERLNREINAREESDIADLEAMRDRLRGTYRLPSDPNGLAVRAGRVARQVNLVRLLGGAVVSSLNDVARPVMIHGFSNVVRDGMAPLIRRSRGVRLAADELRLAGTALDLVLDSRASALAEIGDDYGRLTRFERGLQALSNNFGRISLLSPWTDMMKQFAGLVGQTRILRATETWAAGGKLSRNDLADLASGGIDEMMAGRIAKQVAAHGEDVDGVRWANTSAWTDAEARDAFRAALVKSTDTAIVTPGVGTRPLWMSTELGKLIGQFRSFTMAATVNVLTVAGQRRDASTLLGLAAMVAIGLLQYWLRVPAEKRSDSPADWIAEGVDRSGVLGWLTEANTSLERFTGGGLGLSRLIGDQPLTRYRNLNRWEAVVGPTVGLIGDLSDLATAATRGDWKASDTARLRRLAPFQNLLYVRGLFDLFEDSANSAMGVQ